MIGPLLGWRCFPWEPSAPAGKPFSPSYIGPGQRTGRFDLEDQPPILYLSDDRTHVVTEALQAFRNLAFLPGMLRKHGRPLAVVDVALRASVVGRLADLCDPEALTRLRIAPDTTAHHDRTVTQPLARHIHAAEANYAGVRWWSTVTGAWHTLALFTDRFSAEDVAFGAPRLLAPDDPDVSGAQHMLNLHEPPAPRRPSRRDV